MTAFTAASARRREQRGSTTSKVLIGCGCGCLALIVIAAIAGFGFWKGVVQPMKRVADAVQVHQEQSETARRELRRLDELHGVRLGGDAGTAEIGEEDVVRYLAVREALVPLADRLESARGSSAGALAGTTKGADTRPTDVFRAMRGVVGGLTDAVEAESELLLAAVTVLEAQRIGPSDVAVLAQAVEWRFLRRDEATALGLLPFQVKDWEDARSQLAWSEAILDGALSQESTKPADREQLEQRVSEAKAKLAALSAEAAGRVALTASTRVILESRRAQLAALSSPGIAVLGRLADASLGVPFGGGARFSNSGGWEGAWGQHQDDDRESEPAGQAEEQE